MTSVEDRSGSAETHGTSGVPLDPSGTGRLRIAYLSFSSGEFDARTFRMARSAMQAGYDVTIYARLHAGLPEVEIRDGVRLVRVPFDWRLAVPVLGRLIRGRLGHRLADAAPVYVESVAPQAPADASSIADRVPGPIRPAGRFAFRIGRGIRRRWRVIRTFPLRPLGWASALESVAEPADIWHGMWAGSLPALVRMRRRHGGHAIYDSRDIYMRSREFERLGWPTRPLLRWIERRWALAVDRVVTVNDDYADVLARLLGVARPAVILNCPNRWTAPQPPPDLIRETLGLPPDVAIALYQGRLMSERGIDQAMDAILKVPDAVLVLLGFGVWRDRYAALVAGAPYAGRILLLPPVPPEELLAWTASADVMVMAIQPTTLNHRFTTPQKLFESLAAGVPVVASDLPGMARIVNETGAGVLCDPTSPDSIAAGIASIIGAGPVERAAMRERAIRAAHDTYSWEAQLETLFGVYGSLVRSPSSGVEVAGASPAVERS